MFYKLYFFDMPSDAPVHDQGNARTEKTISKKSVAKSLTTDFHLFSDFATDFHSITAENAKTENSRKNKTITKNIKSVLSSDRFWHSVVHVRQEHPVNFIKDPGGSGWWFSSNSKWHMDENINNRKEIGAIDPYCQISGIWARPFTWKTHPSKNYGYLFSNFKTRDVS